MTTPYQQGFNDAMAGYKATPPTYYLAKMQGFDAVYIQGYKAGQHERSKLMERNET